MRHTVWNTGIGIHSYRGSVPSFVYYMSGCIYGGWWQSTRPWDPDVGVEGARRGSVIWLALGEDPHRRSDRCEVQWRS